MAKTKVEDKLKRINLKSKRLRNLVKKAIELSQMCELHISLVVKDPEMNKFTQYCSGNPQTGMYTITRALEELK